IRNRFAIGFHDLEIEVVDPDPAFEIPLAFLDLPGLDVEHVRVDLVDQLFAGVLDVIEREVVGGENERLNLADILEVLRSQLDAPQRALRGIYDLLGPPAVRLEQDVADEVIFPQNAVAAVKLLDPDLLPVGVIGAGVAKFRLLGGELLDDLFYRDGRRFISEPAFLWSGAHGRRRKERSE